MDALGTIVFGGVDATVNDADSGSDAADSDLIEMPGRDVSQPERTGFDTAGSVAGDAKECAATRDDRCAQSRRTTDIWSGPGLPFPGLSGGVFQPAGDPVVGLADGLAEPLGLVEPADSVEPRDSVEPADLVVVPKRQRLSVIQTVFRWRRQVGRALPTERRTRLLLGLLVGVVLVAVVVGLFEVVGGSTPRSLVITGASASARRGGPIAGSGRSSTRRPASSAGGTAPTRRLAPKSSLPKSALQVPASSSSTPPPASSTPTGLGSSGSAAPPGSSTVPVLTVGEAQLVAQGLWSRRIAALSSDDLPALATVESGVALAGDTAQLQDGTADVAPSNGSLQVLVPSQTTFPWEFVGTETSGGTASLAVFFKATAASAWTISLTTTFPVSSARSLGASGATGTGTPASLASLASAWQQWASAGSPPSAAGAAFLPEAAYQSVGQQVAEVSGLAAMRGLDVQTTFAPSSNAGATFSGGNSLGVSCGAIQETSVYTSSSGQPITQPANRSTWGGALGPGQYVRITQQSVYEVCLGGSSSGTLVLGGTGGVYATTGVGA